MEEEREMCPTCKRDISLANYRTHTAHCRRMAVPCRECGESVAPTEMERHRQEQHSLKVCDQCNISVEAIKMHDHRTMLCPKLLLVCKYCELEVAASGMSEHENSCGESLRECEQCGEDVPLRDWERHLGQWHGVVVQKSPGRQRKQSATHALPTIKADTTSMLPCEFCEGLVPIEKLLEHQAQCVNPTNVRGSTGLRNSASVTNFHLMAGSTSLGGRWTTGGGGFGGSGRATGSTSLTRSHSMHNRQSRSTAANDDFLRPQSSYSNYRSLSRTSSVREGRATTEERGQRSSSLYRQSSFTERSYNRRAESLSRQNSISRSNIAGATGGGGGTSVRYSSAYGAHFTTSPDVASNRRASVFEGYSNYALYSSISQGLDDISYSGGGRLSRRNSISESVYSSRRSGSSSVSASVSTTNSGDYPAVPAMLASYEASQQRAKAAAEQRRDDRRGDDGAVCKDLSRQNSSEEKKKKAKASSNSSGAGVSAHEKGNGGGRPTKSIDRSQCCDLNQQSPSSSSSSPSSKHVKIKLRRKVSFTERDPVIIDDGNNSPDQQQQAGNEAVRSSESTTEATTDEPRKQPRRKKDKERSSTASSKKKRRDRSHDAIKEERRRSQPLGEELFEQVSEKLMALESREEDGRRRPKEEEQTRQVQVRSQQQDFLPVPPPAAAAAPGARPPSSTTCYRAPAPPPPRYDSAFGESSCSSKAITSSECSPQQKPRSSGNQRNSGLFAFGSATNGSSSGCSSTYGEVCGAPASKSAHPNTATSFTEVRMRERTTSSSESKNSSKRSSLDGKTVAGLAQDLAAECAKAFALMESSLSKLSTDFGMGGGSQGGGGSKGEGGGSGPFGLRNKKSRKSRPNSQVQQ